MSIEFLPSHEPGDEPREEIADEGRVADLDVLEIGRVGTRTGGFGLRDRLGGRLGSRRWDEPGWSRRRVWWLVPALLAVGATVWAVTRPSPASLSVRRVAERAATATPSVDPACRKVPDCSVRADVPAAIDRLAHAYLPAGVDVRVHTVVAVNSLTLGNLLVSRDIDATVDSVTVLIRVRRGGPDKHDIVPDPQGMGSLLLHGINSGFVIRLQYLAPETVPPMVGRLQALIRDPRLTSSSG
jgi:hypothetical protein